MVRSACQLTMYRKGQKLMRRKFGIIHNFKNTHFLKHMWDMTVVVGEMRSNLQF